MPGGCIDILMYHSISEAAGATSISPSVFASQMAALAESGVPVITMDDLAGHERPGVIITFDDAFQDFADVAWPILRGHGFRPIVYVPAGLVGGYENWRDCNATPRRIMNGSTIRALSGDGVLFGSHSVSHADLSMLDPAALEAELVQSRRMIEERLGRRCPHFAPPYGSATAEGRRMIAQHYDTSVGTRLGRASGSGDMFDLPRLEMFYFTDTARWRAHLAGRGAAYLAKRKLLRSVRQVVRKVV